MGTTNLKASLQAKMGHWKSELLSKEKEVAQILSLFEGLPALNARVERLKKVMDAGGVIMSEIDPAWSAESIKPRKPNVHKSPVRMGNCASYTLDILRDASDSMSAREIAKIVLDREGIAEPTSAQLQSVANNVDAALRSRQGKVVEHDGKRIRRWRIIV